MKKRNMMLMSLLVVVLVGGALVACTPGGGSAVEQPATQPTAAATGETKTLFVGPELAECTGVGPMQCMQVRESLDAPYTYFYSMIEGFEYEPGYEYELVVNVTELENVPADASSLKYTLVELVSKTPAAATGESSGLDGTRWTLESVADADGNLVAAAPGSQATAEFKDGQVGGNSSCNSYGGSYTVDGDALTVGPLAMTMMACMDEALMAQEAAFGAAMQSAAGYAIVDGKLEIYDAAGQTVLVFAAAPSTDLVGSSWVASAVNNGREAVTSVVAGTEITLEFGADGSLGGSSGCNRYNAGYTLDGESISIGQPAGTKMLCDGEGVMEQEAAFLALLPQAATYAIRDGRLELRTADGALIGGFEPAAAADGAPDGTVSVAMLEGPEWQLTSYLNADGETVMAVEGSQATATFMDGQVGGRGSCNTYGGQYALDGEALTISETFSTMMACEESLMAQEQAFLTNLSAAASYRIDGTMLDIIDAGGVVVLSFAAN